MSAKADGGRSVKGGKGGADTGTDPVVTPPPESLVFRGGGKVDTYELSWSNLLAGQKSYLDGGGSPRGLKGDVLKLEFTSEEWQTFIQSPDYLRLMDYINRIEMRPSDSGFPFVFTSVSLEIRNWEVFEFIVDGAPFNPKEADDDGIPNATEIDLAVLGFGDEDSNNDGIADYLQPSIAVLAWKDPENFNKGLSSDEATRGGVDQDSIVSIQIQNSDGTLESNLRLQDVQVVDTPGENAPELSWAPISFAVTPATGTSLTDIDGDREGTQIKIRIDFANPSFDEGAYVYWKYISQATINAYGSAGLEDLDGNPILTEGWYDFTAREEGGDGATFLFEGGKLVAIELIITDNAFGDIDPTADFIRDPGSFGPATVTPPPITLTVTGTDDVSEGSYAVFTVALSNASASATEISLTLSNTSPTAGAAEDDDYSSSFTAFYYDSNNAKQTLTINAGKISLPAGVTEFYVSVETEDDDEFEGSETFSLTAAITGGDSDSGTSTILDDGTGTVYDEDGEDTEGTADDDQAPAVTAAFNAPSTLWYYSQSNSGPVTYFNRLSIQDGNAETTDTYTVTLSVDGNAYFNASSGGSVTVSGTNTSTLTLTGTLADINAFIASNSIQFDPNSSGQSAPFPDRVVTVTLADSSNVTLSTSTVDVKYIDAENRTTLANAGLYDSTTKIVNWSQININANDMESLSGEKIVTSWSHGPEQQTSSSPNLTYKKGGSSISLIFTADQLDQVLTSSTYRDTLAKWATEADDAKLDASKWNAKVEKGWTTERIGLAAGPDGYVVWNQTLPTSANTHTATESGNLDYASSSSQKLLIGGTGANTLKGGSSHDILAGGAGNDTLEGNAGNDLLLGGTGNDLLKGGAGNDILAGGLGADTFVFAHYGASNVDQIVDYSFVEGDVIDVSALLTGGKTLTGDIQLVQTGEDIKIQFQSAENTWSDVAVLVGYGTGSDFDPIKIVGTGSDVATLFV